MRHREDSVDKFYLTKEPYSADPLEYDQYVHHLAFSSVHATLVSQSQIGQITGVLASSWTNSDDFKVWSFEIRSGLAFENGDPITPASVAHSLTRLAFLMKTRGSKDGVLSHLVGFNTINSPDDHSIGLEVENNQVTFRFSDPMPDLLEAISFGLYGIVHPSMYDHVSGAWKDPHKTISSGFYKIQKWSSKGVLLALRENFLPQIRNPSAPKAVLFSTNLEPNEVDFADGPEDLTTYAPKLAFSGGSETRIIYVRCETYKDPTSPCHDPTLRKKIRAAYYAALKKIGVVTTTSFFPTTIPGVVEPATLPAESIENLNIHGNLTTNYFPDLPSNADHSDLRVMHNSVVQVLRQEGGPNLNLELKSGAAVGSPLLDMRLKMTGIRIDNPIRDVKYMFLSKEGIKLPDTDGSILRDLHKEKVDLQSVNRLLWDQGLIWPIKHVIYGIWYNPKKYDFSKLNTSLPALELQWIGSNPSN